MAVVIVIGKAEWKEYPQDKKELLLKRLNSSNVYFKDAIIRLVEKETAEAKEGAQIDWEATFKDAYKEDGSWEA